MRIRHVVGVLGLMACQLCGPSWAQTAPNGAGSPRPDTRYTLFAELHRPYEGNRARLQKMLRDEGFESHAEREGEIALVLTAEQIKMLFQARVRFRKVEASATDRMITEPYLEGTRIPGRFGKLIRRVYFDPQR
jgi:hypothetical protein